MGAKVIIFGQSLNSQFLKGLTHSAVVELIPGSHQQACTNNSHQRGLLCTNNSQQSFAPFDPHLTGVKSAAMRALYLLSTSVVSLCIGQTNFGAAEENANPSSDVNTRIFTGPVLMPCFTFVSFKCHSSSWFSDTKTCCRKPGT